jgi:hypothetical protein
MGIMPEEIHVLDGGEMTAVAMGLFVHLARRDGPFRVTREEMNDVTEAMDDYRLSLIDGPEGVTITAEKR